MNAVRSGARLRGTHCAVDGDLQVLNIRRRPVIQDDKVDSKLPHPPIFMGAEHLMQNSEILSIVNLQHDDRQIARNSHRPQGRLPPSSRLNLRSRCTHAGIAARDHATQYLKIGGIGMGDPEVTQLNLRLRPGQGRGTRKG